MVRTVLIPLVAVLVAVGALVYAITKPTASPSQVASLRSQVASLSSQVDRLRSLHQAPEAWHEIGAPGQPRFQFGWTNDSALSAGLAGSARAGFYKDPLDAVHLKGLISDRFVVGGSNGKTIFTLPPKYRPGRDLFFQAERGSQGDASGQLNINTDGTVTLEGGGGNASVDGVSFRAGE